MARILCWHVRCLPQPYPKYLLREKEIVRLEDEFQAGVAAVKVTPPPGCVLAGYPIDRPSTGVLDDLHVTTLVLKRGETRLALVHVDVLALADDTVKNARKRIEAITGIPSSHVLVCASHTHTGPVTVPIFDHDPDLNYLNLLEQSIAESVALACTKMHGSRFASGIGEMSDISYNRRMLLKTGGVAMYSQSDFDPLKVRAPEGPTDPSVGIWRIDTEDGKPLAVWVNYASHPDCLTGNLISADYPAYVRQALQAAYGPNLTVCFSQGASGQIECFDPMDMDDMASRRAKRFHDSRGVEKTRRVGQTLAREAIAVRERLSSEVSAPVLATAHRTITLAIRPVSLAQEARAEQLLVSPEASAWEKVIARDVLWVRDRNDDLVDLELQALRVGETALLAMPVELFVEFGLELKRRSPFPITHVVGLANGYAGYIPTLRAFSNGGYETEPAKSSKLGKKAGAKLVEAGLQLLHHLRGHDAEGRSDFD